jgi:hypothetical protein
MAQHVQPMSLIRTSENMAAYTERGQTGTGEYIWAEVIRNDWRRLGNTPVRRRVPSFSVSVHRNMHGQVTEFTYEPKTRPPRGILAPRTLTGLVRAHLAALDSRQAP